jgi:hypothetical protein
MTKSKRPVGRPPELIESRRVHICLDKQSYEIAEELGEGNVSAGIREALEFTHNHLFPDQSNLVVVPEILLKG